MTTPALREVSGEIRRAAFVPPSTAGVDEWADRSRYLSTEASSEPGRWSTDRAPYLREIMQSLTDPDVHRICWVKSAQVGATEVINNWAGHTIECAPGPMLVIQPSLPMAQTWSKDRLAPMLRDCPTLRGRVRDGSGRREADNTIERKMFPGGYVAVVSAGSTASLRSRPVGRIAADERDEWEIDLGGQGDPLALALARATTFWDWKLFEVSTPLDFYSSAIWASWKTSDQRLYEVPCPHCDGRQPLVWRDGEGEDESPDGAGQYRIVCEKDAAGDPVPASAKYQCAHCETLIEERHKGAMLTAGAWVPRHLGRSVRGYRLGGVYSPWFGWAALMEAFLAARHHPASLKTFVNTRLGLPWRETGETIEPHFLQERAETFPAAVPPGVDLLTAGVDVQVDRLEVGLWGWGEREESWTLEQIQLEGDPGQDAVWGLLAELLVHRWPLEHGRALTLASVAVDAGYQTDRVHRFCQRWHKASRPVFATVGRDGRGRPILTPPGPGAFKRARRQQHSAHILGSDSGKDNLHSRLKVEQPGPGYVHFSADLDRVFFEQLTAEELKNTYVSGRPTRKWILREGRRNEALDCAILAHAALVKLGPQVVANLGERAAKLATAPDPEPSPAPAPAPSRARPVRRTPWARDF